MSPVFDWSVLDACRHQLAAGEAVVAVERLRQLRQEYPEPAIATVLADALFQLGQPQEALACLQADIDQGVDNHWTHYSLGSRLAQLGRLEAAAAAFRQSHARQGWVQSLERGYTLTHDYFSGNIPQWRQFFEEVILQAPIRILEIGSWQGGSSLWLLDHVLGPRGGVLHCVDTWGGSSEHGFLAELGITIEALFDANIARNPHGALVEKKKGPSEEVLPGLEPHSYDLIYIDGAHEASFAIQDAIHAHRLVRPGGFLLFDDYHFQFADPSQNTARAIDFFLEIFHSSYSLEHKGTQVLLRRLVDQLMEPGEIPCVVEAFSESAVESNDMVENQSKESPGGSRLFGDILVQLFWKSRECDLFNEPESVSRKLRVGGASVTHSFILPEEVFGVHSLRLDPADVSCLVRIEAIEMVNPGEPALWNWSLGDRCPVPFSAGNDETLLVEAAPGTVICRGGDPSLLLELPLRVVERLRSGSRVSITARWEKLDEDIVDLLRSA